MRCNVWQLLQPSRILFWPSVPGILASHSPSVSCDATFLVARNLRSAVAGRAAPQVDGDRRIEFIAAGADREPVGAGLQFGCREAVSPSLSLTTETVTVAPSFLALTKNSFHCAFSGRRYVAPEDRGALSLHPRNISPGLNEASSQHGRHAQEAISDPHRIPPSIMLSGLWRRRLGVLLTRFNQNPFLRSTAAVVGLARQRGPSLLASLGRGRLPYQ